MMTHLTMLWMLVATLSVASAAAPPGMAPAQQVEGRGLQVANSPPSVFSLATSMQPSVDVPMIPVATFGPPSASPSVQTSNLNRLHHCGPPSVSLAPSIQPSAIDLDINRADLGRSAAAPSAMPSTNVAVGVWGVGPRSTPSAPSVQPSAPTREPSAMPISLMRPISDNTPWNNSGAPSFQLKLMNRESRGAHMAVSVGACIIPRPQNSCFVSSVPGLEVKHNPKLPVPCASNDPTMGLFPNQRRGTIMRATGRDREMAPCNELERNLGDGNQRLIPLLMYAVVPFVPSVLLSTLNDHYQATKGQFNAAYAAMPANIATDSPEYLSLSSQYNETMQQLFVLLLSKRLALYFLATLATLYAGWRASMGVAAVRDGVVGGPGEALDSLNREILRGERFGAPIGKDSEEGKDDDSELFATLIDESPQSANVGNALAVALPLALSATLAFSYLTVSSGGQGGDEHSSAVQELLASSLPYVFSLPSVGLCLLFMATDLRWASNGNHTTTPPTSEVAIAAPILCAGNALALAYVVGAYAAKIYPSLSLNGLYLDLWPLQNGVNFALAATVARGLSPFLFPKTASKSIRTVALALAGIALFDAVSVFGTVANAADIATTGAESSMSVMETVARSKLASSASASPLSLLWQPGLLEIILGHDNSRVTEALGLGDVVFPSILVAWGFAADKVANSANAGGESEAGDGIDSSIQFGGHPYASASVAGYAFGSLATEIVGSFSLMGKVSGLPALVFLVPSMLGAVTATAWSRNELGEVWGSGNGDSGDNSSEA